MSRWPLAAVTALLLALPRPAAAQPFLYLAFGDSITRGYGDTQTVPSGYPLDLAAASRLDCDYNTTGAGSCAIYNEGCAGEKTGSSSPEEGGCPVGGTPGGLTRIETKLDDRAYDVVLLMEGTNDIFNNISPTTAATNLGAMDVKATEAGADTVLASIIWMRAGVGPAVPPAGADAAVEDLHDQLVVLASDNNRYFVDNWNVLCPAGGTQASCFTTHYFDSLHPDDSGYGLLADEFYGEISSVPVPGTPSPTFPAGDVCDTALASFDWTKESPDRANWYQVQIDDTGNLYDAWTQEADLGCDGDTSCALTDPLGLGAGDYSWRVRGRNPLGWGSWSSSVDFSVLTAAPATAAPSTPSGAYAASSPTFVWPEVAGATGYDLQVDDVNPVTVVDESYDTSICTGGTCSATPGALADGAYAWRVRATNACGGSFSPDKAFSVGVGPALPTTPASEILDPTPTYRWTAAANATDYEIEVSDGSPLALTPAPPFSAGSVCAGASCAVTLTSPSLSTGGYSWRVRGTHSGGSGAWSSPAAFSVASCDPTTPLLFENATVSTAQAPVNGCGDIHAGNLGAGDYTVAAGGEVTLHAGGSLILFEGFTVESGGQVTLTADPQ